MSQSENKNRLNIKSEKNAKIMRTCWNHYNALTRNICMSIVAGEYLRSLRTIKILPCTSTLPLPFQLAYNHGGGQ